jgi:hypothetical protein
MRPLRLLSAACVIAPLLTGLAAPVRLQAQDSTAAAPAKKPPKGRANLITEEEIAYLGGTVQTAYGIVQRLRPAMLRVRSGNTSNSGGGMSSMDAGSNDIMVYLDNQKMGGVRALEEITLAQIKEIKYLSASDATTATPAAGNYTRYTYNYVKLDGSVVDRTADTAQNFVRYAEYPGQRLFKNVKFEVNGK